MFESEKAWSFLEHPTAAWLSCQITEAFPCDTALRFLLRDRDSSYSSELRRRAEAIDITEAITAPRSPRPNAYVERVIGSLRRDCLDHILIFNERHLRRVLSSYFDYYQLLGRRFRNSGSHPVPTENLIPLRPAHRTPSYANLKALTASIRVHEHLGPPADRGA